MKFAVSITAAILLWAGLSITLSAAIPQRVRAKYFIAQNTMLRVYYDKKAKHPVNEIFATNRPDIFIPCHRYTMVFTYHDSKGKLRTKKITRKVLDRTEHLGGEPNLEVYVFKKDKKTLSFVRNHLNMKLVKVYEVK